jgi:hypothetical protein
MSPRMMNGPEDAHDYLFLIQDLWMAPCVEVGQRESRGEGSRVEALFPTGMHQYRDKTRPVQALRCVQTGPPISSGMTLLR